LRRAYRDRVTLASALTPRDFTPTGEYRTAAECEPIARMPTRQTSGDVNLLPSLYIVIEFPLIAPAAATPRRYLIFHGCRYFTAPTVDELYQPSYITHAAVSLISGIRASTISNGAIRSWQSTHSSYRSATDAEDFTALPPDAYCSARSAPLVHRLTS